MKKQTGMLALRRLDGKVITNRVRAMPPAATVDHAAAYDLAVLATAHTIIGITDVDGDRYDEQLQSPLATDGFGLTSAVTAAPAAYLAGAAHTLRLSPAFRGVWGTTEPLPPTCIMAAAIDDSLRRIAAMETKLMARCPPPSLISLAESRLPDSAATFAAHYKALPDYPIRILHHSPHRNLGYYCESGGGAEGAAQRL